MVEQLLKLDLDLDQIFRSLADSTRRDILWRVSKQDFSITELAKLYQMSFAAVAKHIKVLEEAKLITKQRTGKLQLVRAEPETLVIALEHLQKYEKMWESRFQALDNILKQ